jgi:hypothetical protein
MSTGGGYIQNAQNNLIAGQGLISGTLPQAQLSPQWTSSSTFGWPTNTVSNELVIRKVENGYVLKHEGKEYIFVEGTQAVKFLELLGKNI